MNQQLLVEPNMQSTIDQLQFQLQVPPDSLATF